MSVITKNIQLNSLVVTNNIQLSGLVITKNIQLGYDYKEPFFWTGVDITTESELYAIAYGDGVFVIQSKTDEAPCLTSNDRGRTWTETQQLVSGFWRHIAYGLGKFIIGQIGSGQGGIIYVSDDQGATFTLVDIGIVINSLSHLRFANDRFFMIHSNKAVTSTDGITWIEQTIPLSGRDVTYGGGKYVISSSGAEVAVSNDAENWNTFNIPLQMSRIVYGNNVFVGCSSSPFNENLFLYSLDGETWQFADTTIPNYKAYDIAYGNGLFVASSWPSGDYNGLTAISSDGISWELVNTPDANKRYSGGVAYGDGVFVAASDSAGLTDKIIYGDW